MDHKASNRIVASMVIFALVFSSVAAVIPVTVPKAYAAVPSIATSADAHGMQWYGIALLRVEVSDPARANDGKYYQNISVTLTQKDKYDVVKSAKTRNFTEVGDAGTFELFVVHTTSWIWKGWYYTPAAAQDLMPANPQAWTQAVLRDSTKASKLVQNFTFAAEDKLVIDYSTPAGSASSTVTYKHTRGSITVDKGSGGTYAPDSTIYVQVYDPDLNLDPSNANKTGLTEKLKSRVHVVVSGSDGKTRQGNLSAVSTATSLGFFNMTETGANTARFENKTNIKYLLRAAGYVTTLGPVNSSRSGKNITMIELRYEDRDTSPYENKSIFFKMDVAKGTIDALPTVTYSSELKVTVTDADRNNDTKAKDKITIGPGDERGGRLKATYGGVDKVFGKINGSLLVCSWSGASVKDYVNVNLVETDVNTGVFQIDKPGNKIKITYRASGHGVDDILTVRKGWKIEVIYWDTDPYYNSTTSRAIASIDTFVASFATDKLLYKSTDTAKFTMTDPDINDDSAVPEFVTATLGAKGVSTYTQPAVGAGSTESYTVGQLTITINGVAVGAVTSGTVVSFVETGDDTGIFKGELALTKIGKSSVGDLTDGDEVKFKWTDVINDNQNITATVRIGAVEGTISFAKDSYPVGRGTVKVKITITDADANTDSRQVETLSLGSRNYDLLEIQDANNVNFSTVVYRPRYCLAMGYGLTDSDVDTTWASSGVTVPFIETGPDTGIFTITLGVPQATISDLPKWVNARLKVVYNDSSVNKKIEAIVQFVNHDATVDVNTTSVKNGGSISITITDPDRNLNWDKRENDTASAYLVFTDRSTSSNTTITLSLTETGKDTGIFTKTQKVNESRFEPKPGTDIEVRYWDRTPIGASMADSAWPDPLVKKKIVKMASHTGTLDIGGITEIGPAAKIAVYLNDPDVDTSIYKSDTTTRVRVKSTTDPSGITLTLEEWNVATAKTDINTGIFRKKFTIHPTLASSEADARIKALPGDRLDIVYLDEANAAGVSASAVATVSVKSWDPTIVFDKTAYMPGDTMKITITDKDANRDPDVIDAIPYGTIMKLTVGSKSDPIGLKGVAVETGKNTGIFESTILLTDKAAISGALLVKVGDNVTVTYKDEYPVDWNQRLGAAEDKAKTFTAEVFIKSVLPPLEQVPASTPEIVDATGKPVAAPTVGQLVIIRAKATNMDVLSHTFTYIVQIKDAKGVVIKLDWIQDITLAAGASSTPGVSWKPEAAGTYTIEVFIWESIEKPIALSPVVSTTATVT